MKLTSSLALAAVFALCGISDVYAQRRVCGPNGCKVIYGDGSASIGVRWVTHDQDPDRSYLYQGNQMLGAWDHPGQYWRALSQAGWGLFESAAPVPPPAHAHGHVEAGVADAKMYFGVTADRLSQDQERFSFRGEPCHKEEAYAAVVGDGQGKLTDDSQKPRISYIDGDAKARDKFVKDFKASPDLSGSALPWEGAPDDWSYEPGFDTSGKPGVIVQAPTGEVLHSQHAGASVSPGLFAALRTPVPGYDKTKDPDLNAPKVTLPKIDGTTVLLAGALGAGILFFRKK